MMDRLIVWRNIPNEVITTKVDIVNIKVTLMIFSKKVKSLKNHKYGLKG